MDYESFLSLAKSRRSIRKYTNQKPTHKIIGQLIETASWAPSSHNRQGWKFIVFENHKEIHDLAEKIRNSIMKSLENSHRLSAEQTKELILYSGIFDQSPVFILAMHKKSPAVGKSIMQFAANEFSSGEVISTAMACQNILLAAQSIGLGACIMTAPLLAGEIWKSLDNLPLGFEPTCLITIGYPAEIPQSPRRKKFENIIEYR
jgi:nitroreductase